jgi:Xaa-Pro aminopeptidase
MDRSAYDARLARLVRAMADAGVDAAFFSTSVNMGYLQGICEEGYERFLALGVAADGRCALICPALTETQARRHGIADVRPWEDGADPVALFEALADEWGLRSGVIAVDDQMPAARLLAMQNALKSALFKPAGELAAQLRRVKDAAELDALRRAAKAADGVTPSLTEWIRPGVTERQLSERVQQAMREAGGTSAGCIVATGANGAEPHHISDDTPIAEGDVVVVDFGCAMGGYFSDITRTFACRHASDEARAMYRLVHEAQAAGRRVIRPGAPAEEVDIATRAVIAAAGHGERFVHRTGHGIGRSIHEDPYIVRGNAQPLALGDCFSVEPGVYFPGRFGIRIENIVTVVEGGHRNLNREHAPELPVAG